MFCQNCGMELKAGVKFCSNCGASLSGKSQETNYQPQIQQPQQPTYSGPYQQASSHYYAPQAYLPQKSGLVAVLLSLFLFPGLGHIYTGKIGKGLGFLFGLIIAGVSFGVASIWLFVLVFPLFIIILLGLIGIQIWCVVDSYITAENYNKFVARHGRAPLSGDRW